MTHAHSVSVRLALLLPMAAAAAPYASDPQDLLFTDRHDVFEDIELEILAAPAGSPLNIRFAVESNGGYMAEIEADSDLYWPDALTHGITGRADGGWMALVTDIDLVAEVIIDLTDIGLGIQTIPVWTTGLSMADEVRFDGLLLADSTPASVAIESSGPILGPFEFSQSVFTGVDLVFKAHAAPRSTAELSGVYIDTESQIQEFVADTQQFPVPSADPGLLDLSSTYVGQVDTSLDLVIVPSVEVCITVVGCLTLAQFDLPVPIATTDAEREFEPVDYSHPLPSLELGELDDELGDVLVGDAVTAELTVYNVGLLDLSGDVTIEGSDAWSVFPDTIYASPGGSDGVTLTFEPGAPSSDAAVLVLTTNDPANPVVEIPLLGVGIEPEPINPDGAGDRLAVESRCGCAPGVPVGGGAWMLGLVGLVTLASTRRRRA